MKVIFLQDVKGQGKKGEVKEVSEGTSGISYSLKGLQSWHLTGILKTLELQKRFGAEA